MGRKRRECSVTTLVVWVLWSTSPDIGIGVLGTFRHEQSCLNALATAAATITKLSGDGLAAYQKRMDAMHCDAKEVDP